MTLLPNPQALADVRQVVDNLHGKAPEGYVANPIIARQVIDTNSVRYAEWVIALAEKVERLESALHFTGYARDYFHVKWKEASGLSDDEIAEFLKVEMEPFEGAAEYLKSLNPPDLDRILERLEKARLTTQPRL